MKTIKKIYYYHCSKRHCNCGCGWLDVNTYAKEKEEQQQITE